MSPRFEDGWRKGTSPMTAVCVSRHCSEKHSDLACLKSGWSMRRGLGCGHPNFCPPTMESWCPFKPAPGEVVQCVCECVFLSRALPRVLDASQPSNIAELSALTTCLMGLANSQCAAVAAPRSPLACQTCPLCETNQMFSLSLLFFQIFLLNSAQRRALWHWIVAWPNWYTTLDRVYSGWDWKQIRLNWCSRWTLNFFALLKPQKQSDLLNHWIQSTCKGK